MREYSLLLKPVSLGLLYPWNAPLRFEFTPHAFNSRHLPAVPMAAESCTATSLRETVSPRQAFPHVLISSCPHLISASRTITKAV